MISFNTFNYFKCIVKIIILAVFLFKLLGFINSYVYLQNEKFGKNTSLQYKRIISYINLVVEKYTLIF